MANLTRDNQSSVSTTSSPAGSSLTLVSSFKVSTHNPMLFVPLLGDATSDLITTVTFNGIAMTLVGKTRAGTNDSRWVYLFYLQGVSGTHDVVVNWTGSPDLIEGCATSFKGAFQTGLDSFATGSGSAITSLTLSTTSVADNSWSIGVWFSNGGALSTGTGTTQLANDSNRFYVGTKNSAITPPGSTSLQATAASGKMGGIIATFAPVTITPSPTKSLLLVKASSQYVTVPDASNLRVEAGSFTVEGWIKFVSLPTSPNSYVIIEKGNVNTGGWGFGISNASGVYQMDLNSYNTNDMPKNITTPTTGIWYHWAVSYDASGSGTATFYLNGVSQGTVSNGGFGFVGTSGQDLYIGARIQVATVNSYFDGNLKDVRVYNAALSGATILGNFNSPCSPSLTNLISWWQLENDYLDNEGSNDGTSHASPTFASDVPYLCVSILPPAWNIGQAVKRASSF